MLVIGKVQEPSIKPENYDVERVGDEALALTCAELQRADLVLIDAAVLRKEMAHIQARVMYASKMTSLGELTANIAHEINNPLGILTILAEELILRAEEQDLEPAKIAEIGDTFKRTVHRMVEIVRGLRGYSRDGQMDPRTKVAVKDIFKETLGLCAEAIGKKGVKIETDCPANLKVWCHSVQISQVLLNLISNAGYAAMKGSEHWVRIEARDIGPMVEIAVVDSGAKIPEPVRAKLFQPFFTTKEVGKGTGLGLPLSRKIIEKHDGKMYYDVQSACTRFVFTLPKS